MEEVAWQQMVAESQNWLNRGRSRFLQRMLERHCDQKGQVLEIGAGAGQNIGALSQHGSVDAVEVSPTGTAILKENKTIRHVYSEPIPELDLDTRYDVICAFDVLEHIKDDGAAMRWILDHLLPGGVLIATVPAFQWLFSDHDVANHHYRRYTVGQLTALVPNDDTVVQKTYFNFCLFPIAVLSRWVWGVKKYLSKDAIKGKKQSSNVPDLVSCLFYRILAGEAYWVKIGLCLPFGLTAFCIVRKE